MIKCSKCGEMVEDGKNFCPNCGNNLTQQIKKTGFPIAGGILLIIAASFCLVAALIELFSILGSISIGYRSPFLFISFIFLIWGFSIGLTGGILTIKRKKFPIVVIGTSFVIVAGCLDLLGTIIFGIIILILAILSIIFIAISKREFQR